MKPTTRPIQVLTLSLALVAFTGFSACSDRVEADNDGLAMADDTPFLTDTEKHFIEYSAEMHVGEIAMAEQAKQKSSNDDVKKYADAVIKTHTDALDVLEDGTERLTKLSTEASGDTAGHMKYLSPLSGAQFDKEFVDLMVADHKSAAETFESEYNGAQNTHLKGYMKASQSELKARWDEAVELQKKLASR